MSKTVKITIHPDAISVKGENRRVAIVRTKDKTGRKKNIFHFRALTSDVGVHPGVKHTLSDNGKIKYSAIGLSDEALIELYITISEYIEKKLKKEK